MPRYSITQLSTKPFLFAFLFLFVKWIQTGVDDALARCEGVSGRADLGFDIVTGCHGVAGHNRSAGLVPLGGCHKQRQENHQHFCFSNTAEKSNQSLLFRKFMFSRSTKRCSSSLRWEKLTGEKLSITNRADTTRLCVVVVVVVDVVGRRSCSRVGRKQASVLTFARARNWTEPCMKSSLEVPLPPPISCKHRLSNVKSNYVGNYFFHCPSSGFYCSKRKTSLRNRLFKKTWTTLVVLIMNTEASRSRKISKLFKVMQTEIERRANHSLRRMYVK